MGFFTAIARWLGGSRDIASEPPVREGVVGPGRMPVQAAGGGGAAPVDDIDADVIDAGPAALAPIVAPKSRAELIGELQKNYTEVLGLVRKVDGHLDQQQRRADRMLAIAEESARKLDALPELAEQNRRVADAIVQLVEITRSGQSDTKVVNERLTKTALQQLEAAQQQTAVLQHVQGAVARAGEAEQQLAASVDAFRGSMGEVSRATTDLGSAIGSMRENDAAREEELAMLVRSSQRWLVIAVVVTGLLTVGVLTLVLTGQLR